MAHGKRAGSRRGAKPQRTFRPALLGLALGVTAAVVAWGYLVFAAIDLGNEARGGRSEAWGFLALASLGAVACLVLGLILLARLSRALGITQAPATPSSDDGQRYLDPATVIGNATEKLAPRHAGPTDPSAGPGHDLDPPTGNHRAVR